MTQNFISKQFLLFLLTGGIAAMVNFSSRIFYNYSMSFSAAIIFAQLTGMVVAFILAKLFVFKESKQSFARSAFFFSLINCAAIAQIWGVSMFLVQFLLPSLRIKLFVHEIAHFTGITLTAFSSYVGHKYWSFR